MSLPVIAVSMRFRTTDGLPGGSGRGKLVYSWTGYSCIRAATFDCFAGTDDHGSGDCNSSGGRPRAEIIATAFAEPGHNLSYENVTSQSVTTSSWEWSRAADAARPPPKHLDQITQSQPSLSATATSGNALNISVSIVTSFVPRLFANATNSQWYAEHSLSRANSRTVRESTSYSAPLRSPSASLWMASACSNVSHPRLMYPARMFRNSLRHNTGTAQSGSVSTSCSAADVYSPGRYRYSAL